MTFVTLVSFDIKRIISQKNEKNKITFIFNHAAYFVSHRLKLVETLIEKGWSVQILIGKAGSKIMEENAYKILKKKYKFY